MQFANTEATRRKKLRSSQQQQAPGGMEGAGAQQDTWAGAAWAGSAPCSKSACSAAPDLFPMQFLLFPEVFHFLCFLAEGLRQLDVTLSYIVYLCKAKKKSSNTYIYIPKNTLLLKSAVVADIKPTWLYTKRIPHYTSPCRNMSERHHF